MQFSTLKTLTGTLLAFAAGCSSTSPASTGADASTVTLVSDFAPPTGRQANPPSESPGEYRILTATSADGITFARTGKVVSDQANVPNMVATPSGTLYLYYTGSGIEPGRDTSAVAISSDGGSSWVYKKLVLQGFDSLPTPSDPDVSIEPDGTFRLFVTQGPPTGAARPAIQWGTSSDGIVFTKGGLAFDHTNGPMDSLTIREADGTWWMHTLQQGTEAMLRSKSIDGKSFTFVDEVNPRIGNYSYFLSGALRIGGTLRVFAFNPNEGVIRSFRYAPPEAPVAEDGVRLSNGSAPLESTVIKDPAVAKLPNGSYVMAYSTKIPAP